MENYRVVCINAKKKPALLPMSSWIKEGEIYTVIHASNMARQRGTLGYKLAEVEIPKGLDYEYYAASRFRPYDIEDAAAEAAVEELLMEELELI
tara:strand:- start:2955 stop:3236 length:282 start_codon:yes stop_codon:yes gene_type:complete